MKNLFLGTAAFAASIFVGVSSAHAETTECTEITSLPTVITVQGVYCLKENQTTGITSGNAIDIQTNNVTIDLNGWKLGGATAGAGTSTLGINAVGRKNIIIRNGSIRGFSIGIRLTGTSATSSGHIIEDILADGNRYAGIWIDGSNTTIRNNVVVNTGNSSTLDQAFGIYSGNGVGRLVESNTVSGVEETNNVFGIRFNGGDDSKIFDNNIFDLKNATNRYGIAVLSVNRALIKGNNVSAASGLIGIGDPFTNSSDIACVGNEVTGFTNNIDGCDTVSGNVTY